MVRLIVVCHGPHMSVRSVAEPAKKKRNMGQQPVIRALLKDFCRLVTSSRTVLMPETPKPDHVAAIDDEIMRWWERVHLSAWWRWSDWQVGVRWAWMTFMRFGVLQIGPLGVCVELELPETKYTCAALTPLPPNPCTVTTDSGLCGKESANHYGTRYPLLLGHDFKGDADA